jgi:hypothetical protein
MSLWERRIVSKEVTLAERHKRLLHLHVPKTAGTALRVAITKKGSGLRVFPHYQETKYQDVNPDDFDFYSGHFGFKTASRIGGDMITVLRNPVDRFLSVYYFWRQLHATGVEVSPNTRLAAAHSLDDFVTFWDAPSLIAEFFNRMTWQIAYGNSLADRIEIRLQGKTDQEIFKLALANLQTFSVVGLQEDLPGFARKLKAKHNIDLALQKVNVTKERMRIADISVGTLEQIHRWVGLDLELYAYACQLIGQEAE